MKSSQEHLDLGTSSHPFKRQLTQGKETGSDDTLTFVVSWVLALVTEYLHVSPIQMISN